MVAELFHNSRLEGGSYGGVHGAHVPALVAGHAGVRRQQGRAREAVIGALRALADGAEQEVACHAVSLRRRGEIAPSVFRLAYRPSARVTASGSFSTILSRMRALRSGLRRPCSQSRTAERAKP